MKWFRGLEKNDFDRGMTEGVRTVTLVLYGSDYEPVSQSTSDNYWKSAGNTLWNFLANQSPMLWIFLILVNVLTYRMKVNKARPKDGSAISSNQSPDYFNSPLGCLVFVFFPGSGPLHLFAVIPYGYKFLPKTTCYFCRVRTCDSCKAVALQTFIQ